jgi:vesicle-fusing ATPase
MDMPALSFTHRVYLSKATFEDVRKAAVRMGLQISRDDPTVNLTISNYHFLSQPADWAQDGIFYCSKLQREGPAQLGMREYPCEIYVPGPEAALTSMAVGVDFFGSKKDHALLEIEVGEIAGEFIQRFSMQVFKVDMKIPFKYKGVTLALRVEGMEHADLAGGSASGGGDSSAGQLLSSTHVNFQKSKGAGPIRLNGLEQKMQNDSLFRSDFDFEKMGIGGLGREFQTMLRKAFATRLFPGITAKMGIKHVRGMLLYGPPGCGKTLIARQIGKVLNAREPKIVNGPELLDKYVGGSEEKVRALFADAEKEQRERGDQSELHIIILDEMDAIMRARGSTSDSTGTQGNVVNQFLSKIDGVERYVLYFSFLLPLAHFWP